MLAWHYGCKHALLTPIAAHDTSDVSFVYLSRRGQIPDVERV